MKSFGINWDFIKNLLGIKSEDVPIKIEEKAMTRKDQILDSLRQGGSGTSRQIAKRLGLSLSVVRTHLTVLHQRGLIRDTGENVGTGIRTQNIWASVDT
tara:strand:- start:671 stop:967 length:297 start_codon:yes stop_codon:yes gene_type:complete